MWNGSPKETSCPVGVTWISLVDARRPRAGVRSRSGGPGSRSGLGCWGLGAAVCRAGGLVAVRGRWVVGCW